MNLLLSEKKKNTVALRSCFDSFNALDFLTICTSCSRRTLFGNLMFLQIQDFKNCVESLLCPTLELLVPSSKLDNVSNVTQWPWDLGI